MANDALQWAVSGPPIGTWKTSCGTFDGVMQDTLTLAVDGTGWLHTRSTMQGEAMLPVMWRQPGPGQIELTALYPEDDPSEAPEFELVRYRTREVERDVGGLRAVLQNIDDDVFWTLAGPLELDDRVPRPPPLGSA